MTYSIIDFASRHYNSNHWLQSSRAPHSTTKHTAVHHRVHEMPVSEEWHCLPCCSNGPLSRAARSQKAAARLNQRFCRCAAGHSGIRGAALHHLVTRDMMERRTVDGVDKRHDAQRARSRASGAESNPTNTTADPVAAAGGHVGGGVKVWCGERAASGRVASSASSSMRPEPILAPFILGRRPKHVCHYPSLGRIRYKKLEKVTDVRYGPPLLPTDLPP